MKITLEIANSRIIIQLKTYNLCFQCMYVSLLASSALLNCTLSTLPLQRATKCTRFQTVKPLLPQASFSHSTTSTRALVYIRWEQPHSGTPRVVIRPKRMMTPRLYPTRQAQSGTPGIENQQNGDKCSNWAILSGATPGATNSVRHEYTIQRDYFQGYKN